MDDRNGSAHPIDVEIFDDTSDDLHHTTSLAFAKELLLQYLVQEFSTFHEFCHQENVLGIFEGVA